MKPALALSIFLMIAQATALAHQQVPSSDQDIEGHAAVEKVIGNTMTGTADGVPYFAYYETTGTVKMQRGGEVASGQWSRDRESLCEEFPDDDDETCYTIRLDAGGMKGTMTDTDGTAYTIEILPGNPQKL